MRCNVLLIALAGLLLCSCSTWRTGDGAVAYGSGATELSIATGSPGELGLLKVLAEEFSREHDARIVWHKAGTGESLQLLHDRKVDAIMVHAPAAEMQAVREGWAAARALIGSNEFVLVGPPDDPGDVRSAHTIVEAYRRIAASRARFFSRADDSGTHRKEMAIWQKTGIVPSGDWYVQTHDFMMATLLRADAEAGYFMSDSSTWITGKSQTPHLKLLFKGDPFIVNVYHALTQPPGATAQAPLAASFVDFLVSEKAQQMIRDFGRDRYGESLYDDAQYARQYE